MRVYLFIYFYYSILLVFLLARCIQMNLEILLRTMLQMRSS